MAAGNPNYQDEKNLTNETLHREKRERERERERKVRWTQTRMGAFGPGADPTRRRAAIPATALARRD